MRLVRACAQHGVPIGAVTAGGLIALLDRIALEPQNLTAIDGVGEGIDRHLADSLVALSLEEVRSAQTLCDLGSGGGFPGIPLATLLPECAVTLVESERAKADWLARATAGSPNVRVVADRSEALAASERASWSVVTARAVGSLPVVLELAAPLLVVGGVLIAWRGRVAPDEQAAGNVAAATLGLAHDRTLDVEPFPRATRVLDVWRKVAPTPARYPRRPGRAAKRPIA